MTDELWLSVNLSMVCPGLGQVYLGQRRLGFTILGGELGLLSLGIWQIFTAAGNTVTGLGLLLTAIALYVISLIGLYRAGKHRAGVADQALSELAKRSRHPWFAFFLSHVLPGLGQLYTQSALWAALFLSTLVVTSLLTPTVPGLVLVPPLVWMVACYHAYAAIAPKVARRAILGWLGAVVLAIGLTRLGLGLIPVWMNATVYRFVVPSESMLPTLQVNDQMFATPAPTAIANGDIIVFSLPPEAQERLGTSPETLFVKRVIATAGQTVQVTNGQVMVNGQPLAEPYVAEPPQYALDAQTVPPGHVFVLGDNRNVSADSHVWGMLPVSLLIGKPYKIYWPPARIQPIAMAESSGDGHGLPHLTTAVQSVFPGHEPTG